MMTGLVQQADFSVLPNVSPVHCVTLTLASWTPVLVKLFKQPSPQPFLKSVTVAAFSSFFFGYHVHILLGNEVHGSMCESRDMCVGGVT